MGLGRQECTGGCGPRRWGGLNQDGGAGDKATAGQSLSDMPDGDSTEQGRGGREGERGQSEREGGLGGAESLAGSGGGGHFDGEPCWEVPGPVAGPGSAWCVWEAVLTAGCKRPPRELAPVQKCPLPQKGSPPQTCHVLGPGRTAS